MRLLSSALGLALLAAAHVQAAPAHQSRFVPGLVHDASINLAAVHSAQGNHGELPGKYIVKLKDGITSTSFLAHQQLINAAQVQANAYHSLGSSAEDHGIRHVYDLESHLQGYAGQFTDDVLSFIRAQPEVEYVERDSIVKTQEIRPEEEQAWLHHSPIATSKQLEHKHLTEKGAPWGLARISHREELGFGTFNRYVYDESAGSGVTAYIIDTGIYTSHSDFEGRARWGKTFAYDGDHDGNGHGTHCAGTIGGKTYGVAKNADLVAVKVLSGSGSGSMSDVTAGVLWAVNDAKEISAKLASSDPATRKKHKGFVANMSLGGGKSPTLDAAVNGAVASGVHFAVAAGNENSDACNVSPGGAKLPVTVGASDVGDKRAYFSNKGKCVDIFAPGLNIKSTWNTGKDATAVLSGTSMATPHTVGLLAYLLSIYGSDDFATIKDAEHVTTFEDLRTWNTMQDVRSLGALAQALPLPNAALEWVLGTLTKVEGLKPKASVVSVLAPADLKKALVSFATKNVLTDVQGSPNALAFNNATALL